MDKDTLIAQFKEIHDKLDKENLLIPGKFSDFGEGENKVSVSTTRTKAAFTIIYRKGFTVSYSELENNLSFNFMTIEAYSKPLEDYIDEISKIVGV